MKGFEILITSPPDRENLVAEIWHNDNLIAEINQETEKFEIEFYLNGKMSFELTDFLEALQKAKNELMR